MGNGFKTSPFIRQMIFTRKTRSTTTADKSSNMNIGPIGHIDNLSISAPVNQVSTFGKNDTAEIIGRNHGFPRNSNQESQG